MDDDDRIDFSALDPSRQAQHWEAAVQRTLRQAQPESAWRSLGRVRAGLVALAALALLSWVPAWLFETTEEPGADPALALLHYSQQGDVTALMESAHGH